ncbi:MAG: peptidylprolyl isomerase [Prolixibacteraceae bacterium]|nr:peptidylprolyl isomerase [Prolixibacteraceae bacterium]
MMKQVITIKCLLLLIILSISVSAKNNNIIVTIDGRKITKDEYEKIYQKNNTNLNDESDVKTPEEYMEMFIDFKLKVIEAENRGLDTTKAFLDEFNGYRDELAKGYLTDREVNDSIVKEIYNRTVNYIKASHILLTLDSNASPEDTLMAYNKMIDIRNKILNNEMTFEEAAVEYSNDPSAAENKGDLGYFSAFKMISEFEDGCYNTPVGEISMPVRTNLGYHLIKIVDKQYSKGEVKVAHIMKRFAITDSVTHEEDMRLKAEIDSLYLELENGADFGTLARENSDDRASGNHDGVMKFINLGFFAPEFTNAAFELKNDGDYSKPVRTRFGWHIVKRLEYRPPKTFDEVKADIKSKVKANPRRTIQGKKSFIAKLKKDYGFIDYPEHFNQFTKIISETMPDTLKYEIPENAAKITLFEFAGKSYSGKDFIDYLIPIGKVLTRLMPVGHNDFIEKTIIDYEDQRLEIKYPEFKSLLDEYHDGILLFTVMESDVWNVAMQDTTGLLEFYEKNKGKYVFGEHFDGLYIHCFNTETRKKADSLLAAGITDPDQLTDLLNANGERNVMITKSRWEKGASRNMDYLVWKEEKPKNINDDLYFVWGEIKNTGVKTLDEARGLYISDYQEVIEDEWLKHLRQKYEVIVNKKLLRKVKSLK